MVGETACELKWTPLKDKDKPDGLEASREPPGGLQPGGGAAVVEAFPVEPAPVLTSI